MYVMRKKKKILIIEIILIMITFIGLSYSFFRAHSGREVITDVRITTHTVDTFTLSVDENISLEATQQNFVNGGNNISGEANATAILTPNSKTGAVTKNYYLYLNLTRNDIIYSSANTNLDPELMLQVFDSSDNLVTLTGLGTQKTVDGLTGYDITGVKGLITILDNHEINATNNVAITEEWRVVITLVNLDINQNDNTGCRVVGSLAISEDAPTEPSFCTLWPNSASCQFASITNNTTNLTNGYLYHHDSTLTNGANDGSFRYSGVDPNNYVCFGSNAATCPSDNLYRIIGVFSVDVVTDSTTTPVTTESQTLYKVIRHNFETETTLGLTKRGTAYSYSNYPGASSNHPSGAVDGFYWVGNSGVTNSWSISSLNTVGLNTNVLSDIGSVWANKIANVVWKVGGNMVDNLQYASSASVAYSNEMINPDPTNAYDHKTETTNKIGLMYVNDYVYAAPQFAWSTSPSNYYQSTIASNNWLLKGVNEWTITRNSDDIYRANHVEGEGYLYYETIIDGNVGARRVFYLTKNTEIDMTNHAGTINDPYRIR